MQASNESPLEDESATPAELQPPEELQHPPDMFEEDWTPAQIAQLFCDLREGARVLHVQARLKDASGPSDVAVTLKQAEQLFHDRAVTAIQVRYEFESETWCDTLMILPDSVRIIRNRGVPGAE